MRFNPPKEFFVEEPTKLDEALSRLTDEVERALFQLDAERSAKRIPRRIRGAATVVSFGCAFDELLVIDTNDAAVTIVLPRTRSDAAGRAISYARKDTANALTFQTADGRLINGAASFSAAAAVGRQPDIINDGTAWWA